MSETTLKQTWAAPDDEMLRLRVIIEVDVPKAGFDRNEFNNQAVTAANSLEMGNLKARGQRTVLCTTEEVER